jgi:hypothetical protein
MYRWAEPGRKKLSAACEGTLIQHRIIHAKRAMVRRISGTIPHASIEREVVQLLCLFCTKMYAPAIRLPTAVSATANS